MNPIRHYAETICSPVAPLVPRETQRWTAKVAPPDDLRCEQAYMELPCPKYDLVK